jgi:hypothetical protein
MLKMYMYLGNENNAHCMASACLMLTTVIPSIVSKNDKDAILSAQTEFVKVGHKLTRLTGSYMVLIYGV